MDEWLSRFDTRVIAKCNLYFDYSEKSNHQRSPLLAVALKIIRKMRMAHYP